MLTWLMHDGCTGHNQVTLGTVHRLQQDLKMSHRGLYVRGVMVQDRAASAAEHPANLSVEGQGARQWHAMAHLG